MVGEDGLGAVARVEMLSPRTRWKFGVLGDAVAAGLSGSAR